MPSITVGKGTFELEKLYVMEIGQSSISNAGRKLIEEYLREEYYDTKAGSEHSRYRGSDIEIYGLADHVEFVWKDEKGITFPKRMGKYLADTYKIKLSAGQTEKLGQLAKDNSLEIEKTYFDFTQNFDWRDGDFADGGSCFWHGREGARDILHDLNSYAIRFYRPLKEGEEFKMDYWEEDIEGEQVSGKWVGYARAWVIPYTDTCYVVINGYGMNYREVANRLSTFTDISNKKVAIRFEGRTDGTLWIGAVNGEGLGHGYIIGEHGEIQEFEEIDLSGQDYVTMRQCDECGNRFAVDTMYDYHGHTLCENCFDEHYITCDHCQESVEHDDTYTVANGEVVCERCFHHEYSECDHCHEVYPNEEVYETHGLGMLCENCLSNYTNMCDNCNEYFDPDDTVITDEGTFCHNCHEELEDEQVQPEETLSYVGEEGEDE